MSPALRTRASKGRGGERKLDFLEKVAKNPESNDKWLYAEAEVTPCLVKWSSVLLENSEQTIVERILVEFFNFCFQIKQQKSL